LIYIYSHVYNANKTLHRAVESVLNQTKRDFVWYLCDNGSTDNTREIIISYAEKDKRIIPELREINHHHPDYKGVPYFWLPTLMSICKNGNDDDFFCTLDADDEYELDFLKKTLAFIDENTLEVAACGSDFLDEKTNSIIGKRALPQNLILDSSEKFDAHFSEYHQFMRTIWGKLYRLSLLKQCDFENYLNNTRVSYGLDTIFCMRAFSRANRAGILAGTLHKYYVSSASSSYSFENKRIISDPILDDEARTMLIEKTGIVSSENDDFLKVIYFNAILDTLNVLLKSQIFTTEKLCYIKDIVLNNKTQVLLSSNYLYNYGLDEKMRYPLTQYILSQKECRKKDNSKAVAEIIMAMYGDLQQMVSQEGLEYIILKMPEMVEYLLKKDYIWILERLRKWFKRHNQDVPSLTELEIFAYVASGKSDEEIFKLFITIKKNRPQTVKALDIDTQIYRLIEKYSLLKNMSIDLLLVFPNIIRYVMKEDYKLALEMFISVQNVEINDDDLEAYILFGQNLSAAAEEIGVYIYFKKVWLSYLIDCSRVEEASKELEEYKSILPDDEDFIELQKRMDGAR
jgi:glycosyltransferase involved in cell wall biosynthesis